MACRCPVDEIFVIRCRSSNSEKNMAHGGHQRADAEGKDDASDEVSSLCCRQAKSVYVDPHAGKRKRPENGAPYGDPEPGVVLELHVVPLMHCV